MATTHQSQPNARILRVSDSAEYFGFLTQNAPDGAAILAEALEGSSGDDLYVVSYEEAGRWQVFVGQVSSDHGIVETSDGLFMHSVVLKPSTLSHVAL